MRIRNGECQHQHAWKRSSLVRTFQAIRHFPHIKREAHHRRQCHCHCCIRRVSVSAGSRDRRTRARYSTRSKHLGQTQECASTISLGNKKQTPGLVKPEMHSCFLMDSNAILFDGGNKMNDERGRLADHYIPGRTCVCEVVHRCYVLYAIPHRRFCTSLRKPLKIYHTSESP